MTFIELTEKNLDQVIKGYIRYYNDTEGGCWSYEKAYKRIHQVMTIEGAMCRVMMKDGQMIGFWMGYYKEFDDLTAYFLEEIVIFAGYQNKGYGSLMMTELERSIQAAGAEHIELISVNDAHHMHFYERLGFYAAKNLAMMGKHF